MTTLEESIAKAEEKLSEARRNTAEYKALYDRWLAETAVCVRVLAGLREAAGLPPEEQARPVPTLRLPVEDNRVPNMANRYDARLPKPPKRTTWTGRETPPAKAPAPEAQPEAARPFPPAAATNGFDRLAAKRQCRVWRIGYPLTRSSQTMSTFGRQALRRTLTDHDDYDKWLAQGGKRITSSQISVTRQDERDCAEFLGVNYHAVKRQADALFNTIMTYGERGIDYV